MLFPPERAAYQVVGGSGKLALCRSCAVHVIKSLAARFVMFDPSATRDLMNFFASEVVKKRSAKKRRRPSKQVIDVVVPPQLDRKKAP
jgi:hypothetical protein